MNVSAYRSICFSVVFSLLSVCVRAAETIDFNDYELGSVRWQPSAAASQWNSNLTATQNPVWVVVDGLGPDGSKCLSSTETASSTDQWVRADYSWDETVVSETGFNPEGIYLFSIDICLLQTSMPSGNMDVFVNYQQGANSLGNSNTRVTYFAIDGKGTINFQDAGWKRLNGFLYDTTENVSTGWHTIQVRMDYGNGVYDILVDANEVVSDYAFNTEPEKMASFQGIRIRNCMSTLEGTRLLVDNISLMRLDRPKSYTTFILYR